MANKDYKQMFEQNKEEEILLKSKALLSLVIQYPGLKELEKIHEKDIDSFIEVYDDMVKKAVSDFHGIPFSGIQMIDNRPYINKSGLICLAHKDPRKVKSIRSIPILLPFEIEILNNLNDSEMGKYFIGYSKNGTAVYQGIIEFQDGSIYEDQGTATTESISGHMYYDKDSIGQFINETASTRAINRAIRLSIGQSIVSAEEINKSDFLGKADFQKDEVINDINKKFDKLKYNDAKKLVYFNKYIDTPHMSAASIKDLNTLNDVLDEEIIKKDKKSEQKKKNK